MISRIMLSLRKAANTQLGDLSPGELTATGNNFWEFFRSRGSPIEERNGIPLDMYTESQTAMRSE